MIQNNPKNRLYALVLILLIASLGYRVLSDTFYYYTSILFVGLPTLITLLIIRFASTPKTSYGVMFKTISLFLFMSGILFGEGTICILMAAPIFYGIGALIVSLNNYYKEKNDSKLLALIYIPIAFIIIEPLNINSKPKNVTQTVSRIVKGNIQFENFNSTPQFNTNLPIFFQLGFPKPIDITGTGINIGDLRKIKFESKDPEKGYLELKVAAINNEQVEFDIIKDTTPMSNWIELKKVKVQKKIRSNFETEIIWSTTFTCKLGPNWYFLPIESYAIEKMNDFLITSYFNK